MKIPNKIELKQIAFNHSTDTDFQDFINLYKKCTAKTYLFLVTDGFQKESFRKNVKTNYGN